MDLKEKVEEFDPVAIQSKTVQRGHFQDGMFLGVILFLGPLGELAVERFQRSQIQGAGQKLLAHTAKKALDFSLGGSIPDGRVMQEAANPGANLDDFLGTINGAVIDIERLGDASFIEGSLQGLNESVDILGRAGRVVRSERLNLLAISVNLQGEICETTFGSAQIVASTLTEYLEVTEDRHAAGASSVPGQ